MTNASIDGVERRWLLDWLARRGASEPLMDYVRLDFGADARELADEDAETLLEGMLVLAIEPRVVPARVEALVAIARALGYRDRLLDRFLASRLRITRRRLLAYGTLDLHVGATADQVKAAHRALMKLAHPDRLVGATGKELAAAERRVRELNEARNLLAHLDEVDLDGEDDVALEPAVMTPLPPVPAPASAVASPLPTELRPMGLEQAEDAPTELYDEITWSEADPAREA